VTAPNFVVIAGPDQGLTFTVRPGAGNLLGRHADAAYPLNDPRVSRFHCELQSDGGAVTVVDQGGSGGTRVNGVKVTRLALSHGDVVQVGDMRPKRAATATRARAPKPPSTLLSVGLLFGRAR
jgi:pSer/pThr/pTyr-binding forkhead associated (FHA) protein